MYLCISIHVNVYIYYIHIFVFGSFFILFSLGVKPRLSHIRLLWESRNLCALQSVAVCCSVLQCRITAYCHSVHPPVAHGADRSCIVYCWEPRLLCALRSITVCCFVLQCRFAAVHPCVAHWADVACIIIYCESHVFLKYSLGWQKPAHRNYSAKIWMYV